MLIYNDGHLPENWTEANLFTNHTSRPHNPDIANAFFRSGLIEAWGRGIEKITNACKDAGKPLPFYQIMTNEVMIGFYTDVNIGENIGDSIGVNISVNATQAKILEIMHEKPNVSARALAKAIGIAPRNVEANIRALKKAGLVERFGSAKSGHWNLK